MNADLLIQHSIYIDYPVWRLNLQRHRDKFNKVIIYPSDHNREHSFKPFLEEQLKETWVNDHTIDWTTPGIDWRQAETEPMLPLVESEWVYFNEPDWFIKDHNKFYNLIEDAMKEADAVGWLNPTNFPYLHPASFFVKKSILDKTNLDFRAHPEIPGCDHFAMITRDLEKMGAKIISYQDLGMNCDDFSLPLDAFHLGGLTSNYIDSHNKDYKFHRVNEFYVYNWWSRQVPVPKNLEYLNLSSKAEELVKQQLTEEINPQTSKWAEYFK